jgi:hypothetical protein
MDVDLISPDVNTVDQGGKQGALAWSSRLGPGLGNLRGSRDQPALRCRVGTSCRLIDAAAIDKPLAHSAGHELLDFFGWDPQPEGAAGSIFGDQAGGRHSSGSACRF